MYAEQDFTDRDHLRTHDRWEATWAFVGDDGVTPIAGVTSYLLAGALRTVLPAPAVTLDLAHYLGWTAPNVLRLAVPAAVMSTLAAGEYYFEIRLEDTPGEGRTVLAGRVEIRLSVAR